MKSIIDRIIDLEIKVVRLEKIIKKSYIPNQHLKKLRERLIKLILSNKNKYQTIKLSEGEMSFNFAHLVDMKDIIKKYGNFYVLFLGSQCDLDISFWVCSGYNNPSSLTNFLEEHNIIRLYDNKIDSNKAFLIALKHTKQKNISIKNIVEFIREPKE